MRRFALLVLSAALLLSCAHASPLAGGATPLGANFSAPNLAVFDLIYTNTSLTITDINNTVYIGPNGTNATMSDASVGLFDFRPYRSVIVYYYTGTLSGGSTPKSGAQVLCYGTGTYPGAGYWVQQVAPAQNAGGVQFIALGEVPAPSGTGANGQPAISSYLSPFCSLQLQVTGGPTGVGAPGVLIYIYGRR